MGDLQKELAGLCRIARPVEFDSGGTYKTPHALIQPDILEGQHAIRAWEYSQAHRARERWSATYPLPDGGLVVADVGGAGSQFYRTLLGLQPPSVGRVDIVDPAQATPDGARGILHVVGEPLGTVRVSYPLAEWAGYKQNCEAYHAVFCLSVIEHVADPQPFLQQLCSLVCPGGLLFLTMDCGVHSADLYHFHWMRAWIADPLSLARMTGALEAQGLQPLDAPDWVYRGATVYDYTVASIALERLT